MSFGLLWRIVSLAIQQMEVVNDLDMLDWLYSPRMHGRNWQSAYHIFFLYLKYTIYLRPKAKVISVFDTKAVKWSHTFNGSVNLTAHTAIVKRPFLFMVARITNLPPYFKGKLLMKSVWWLRNHNENGSFSEFLGYLTTSGYHG